MNVGDFLDIESLYNHLEKKAIDYRCPEQIGELFSRVLDKMRAEKKRDEEVKAQCEVNVFYFTIEDSFVKPSWAMRKPHKNKNNCGDFSMFTDSMYAYIDSRLESTKNPLLQAHYAHLLWLSPKKHGKYAKIAVDAYLKLTKLYEQKDREIPNQHFGLEVIKSIKNAFYLTFKLRDKAKLDAIKREIVRLIFSYDSQSTSLFALRANLMGLMLDEKVFSKDQFTDMTGLCFSFAKELVDGHKSITLFELGERIDQKMGSATYNWKQLIGETYEKMMIEKKEKDKLVALAFCQDALRYYRQAKNAEKIDELEHVYKELKEKIEFPVLVFWEANLEKAESLREKAKTITQYAAKDIIKTLMLEKDFLPTSCQVEAAVDKKSKTSIADKLAPISIFDARGNIAQHFNTEEERKYCLILRQYAIELETTYLPLIRLIILEAMKEKKLTFSSLMDFFRENSWFGKPLIGERYNREFSYDWLNLLAPSILEFFNQTEYFIVYGSRPNLVLCIDSLTLKIEGLVRDLCDKNDIAKIAFKHEKGKSEEKVEEKNLNELLYDQKVMAFFDKDDLLFFKFVLIEKAGYNLRHKVAHSLMNYQDYRDDFSYLLLLLLLKLGKYNFPTNGEIQKGNKK